VRGGIIVRSLLWFVTGLILLAVALGPGCGAGDEPLGSVELPPLAPVVLVMNGLGETLSLLDLTHVSVANNVLPIGAVPNDLVLAGDGRTVLVAASGANRLEVVDLDRLELVRAIDLGPGSNPYAIAIAGDGTAYVSEWLADRVARVDWQAGAIISRIAVGASPQGMAAHDGRVYVACSGYALDPTFTRRGELAVLAGDSLLATLTVGRNPQTVLVVEDEIHVICTGRYGLSEGQVMIIDPSIPAVIDSVRTGGGPGFAVRDDDRVYLAGYYGGLLSYHWPTRQLLHGTANPVLALEGLSGLDLDLHTRRLYVSLFADDLLLAVEADTLAAQWVVGDGPLGVRVRRSAAN